MMATRQRFRQRLRNDRCACLALSTLTCLSWQLPGSAAALPDRSIFDYLNQKYSLELGDSRGACGYFIDSKDIYQYGNDRVLTVKVSSGSTGTGCKGVLQFRLLQVNCQTNTVHELALQGGGIGATWQNDELTLYPPQNNVASEGYTVQAAKKVCSLPTLQGKPPQP